MSPNVRVGKGRKLALADNWEIRCPEWGRKKGRATSILACCDGHRIPGSKQASELHT